MQPLKNAEQLVRVFHLKTGTVVLHIINPLPLHVARTNFNEGRIALPRVFERIGKQVRIHLLQQHRVGLAIGQFRDGNLYASASVFRLQLLQHVMFS